MEHEGAGGGDHGHGDGGGDCSTAEVLGHVRLVQASGVPHQVDRGQVGGGDDGQDPTDDGGRVDPAVHRIPRLAAGRHSSRRDPAHDRAHAVGDQHRGGGEPGSEQAPVPGRDDHLAEGEARPAQHDAQGRDHQRHEQGQRDRGVGLRERRPQHDEDEDQPDVVGFPHRSDRVFDDRPRAGAAFRAARGQVPEPGPEIGAAEHGVGEHRRQQHHSDRGNHRTASSSGVGDVSSGGALWVSGGWGRRAHRGR